MTFVDGDLYSDPTLFDILYTPGTARDVDILQRVARRHGCSRGRSSLWLEPACGTGRYLRCLAGRGQPVVGFDRDRAMLAYASARLERRRLNRLVELHVGDLVAFPDALQRHSVDFALNLVDTIRHLRGDRPVLQHFAQIARVLRPGAIYVVGISLLNSTNNFPDEIVSVGVRGRCSVRQIANYQPPGSGSRQRRETVLSHLLVERPRGVQHFDTRYHLRTYTARQWRSLIRRSPLRRLASLDSDGAAADDRRLPYQFEVLAVR